MVNLQNISISQYQQKAAKMCYDLNMVLMGQHDEITFHQKTDNLSVDNLHLPLHLPAYVQFHLTGDGALLQLIN